MATAYTRLAEIRDRAVKVRDSLPIGSVEGALYTELVDALEAAILEVERPKTVEEKDEEDRANHPLVTVTMPERFDFDAFLLDLLYPPNQMGVWDSAGIWS